jgi:hypothetical protein
VGYERLYVRAGAVPSPLAHEARRHVEDSVVPDLMEWLAGILTLSKDSPVRRQKQIFQRLQPEHWKT